MARGGVAVGDSGEGFEAAVEGAKDDSSRLKSLGGGEPELKLSTDRGFGTQKFRVKEL